ATGAASFQIPVFTTPSTGPALPGYTTLYADAAGIASDTWFTSWAIGGGAGAGGFDAGDSATLSALVAVMDPDYQVLAFGFNVVDADSATVVSLEWAGDTYWFLPAAPTATVTPTSLTES